MTFTHASWWDCTDEEYYASSLPGSTALHKALTGEDGPDRKTGDLGNAIHLAILRPHELQGRIAVKPAEVCVGSGKGQRDRLAKWEAENAGKLVLTETEHDAIVSLAVTVSEHPMLARVLGHSKRQVEIAATAVHAETGIKVRVRVDFRLLRLLIDLKGLTDPSPEAMPRHLIDYGYALQAALYSDVVEAVTGEAPDYAWLNVGKRAPFPVAFVPCSPEWLEVGRRLYEAALRKMAAARARQLKRVPLHWEGVATPIGSPPPWVEDFVARHEAHAKRMAT